MSQSSYYEKLNELFADSRPFVSVIVVDTVGSVPQDAGTKMLVTADGLFFGTVGGGKVEKRAIEEAQRLLANLENGQTTHFVNWSLSRDIGMTCGGAVKLYFETYNLNTWQIVIFGAGHVAQAVTTLLNNLECRITCIDPRPEWLQKLPESPKLRKVLAEDMPAEVARLPDSAFILLMTMGHTTDKPILLEILKNERTFPYLGVIGSAAKAARLKQDIAEAGLPADYASRFYCPMGLDLGSNHPHEIALSIVAQLLSVRDQLRERSNTKT